MPKSLSPSTQNKLIEQIVQNYGDLIFDLCESILWSPINAQIAFRAIIKQIHKHLPENDYQDYQRAWVLRTTYDYLSAFAQKHARRLSPSEQIMLDATLTGQARLKQFDSYFHRLPTDEQVLLLLRDKYGLPYPEIAAAMSLPEGSIKVRRQQALRNLEDWLWVQE